MQKWEVLTVITAAATMIGTALTSAFAPRITATVAVVGLSSLGVIALTALLRSSRRIEMKLSEVSSATTDLASTLADIELSAKRNSKRLQDSLAHSTRSEESFELLQNSTEQLASQIRRSRRALQEQLEGIGADVETVSSHAKAARSGIKAARAEMHQARSQARKDGGTPTSPGPAQFERLLEQQYEANGLLNILQAQIEARLDQVMDELARTHQDTNDSVAPDTFSNDTK